MTSYGGRKAPNVSHYIANLNALPSAHDVASQHDENFNIDAELAQFTNTEFLDFDTGTLLEQPFSDFGGEHEESGKGDDKSDVKAMDFVNGMSSHGSGLLRTSNRALTIMRIPARLFLHTLKLPTQY